MKELLQKIMTADIRYAEFPDDRRILMASDVHGHADGLKTLLKTASFDEKDILVLVGDFVDKGLQSLKTVRYVMELCKQYTVYPLMGNTDWWRIRSILSDDPVIQQHIVKYTMNARKWWPETLLDEMCRECGIALDEKIDTQTVFPVLRRHFAREITFLAQLPTILETQKFIFVHGGIPHERLNELEGAPAHPLMKWDHFMKEGLSFQKYVVVGHYPVSLYSSDHPCSNPVIERQRHILSLDGGCGVKSDGQLNLLAVPNWRSEAFTYYTWSPLPVITALDSQEASSEFSFIHWDDNEVEVLEKGEELALIRYHGKKMNVPADNLWEQDGKTLCDDFTDYRLPVTPGDQLYLVKTSPLGAYVQKNGCTGWYTGRYIKLGH